MTVHDNHKAATVPFSTIKVGEMFTDEEGDFMMRTEELICDGHAYNVVNLETGDMYSFEDAEQECIKIHRAYINIHE